MRRFKEDGVRRIAKTIKYQYKCSSVTYKRHVKSIEISNRLRSNKDHPYIRQVDCSLSFNFSASAAAAKGWKTH